MAISTVVDIELSREFSFFDIDGPSLEEIVTAAGIDPLSDEDDLVFLFAGDSLYRQLYSRPRGLDRIGSYFWSSSLEQTDDGLRMKHEVPSTLVMANISEIAIKSGIEPATLSGDIDIEPSSYNLGNFDFSLFSENIRLAIAGNVKSHQIDRQTSFKEAVEQRREFTNSLTMRIANGLTFGGFVGLGMYGVDKTGFLDIADWKMALVGGSALIGGIVTASVSTLIHEKRVSEPIVKEIVAFQKRVSSERIGIDLARVALQY